MSVTIRKSGKKLMPDDLAAFEGRVGLRIPVAYRRFLLDYNGGQPDPDCFPCTLLDGSPFPRSVRRFFGIGVEHGDLEWEIEIFHQAGRIPEDLFPVATDHFGNLVLLGMDGPRVGKVYFWDHNFEKHDVVLVANSFDDFLGMLYSLPEEPE